MHMKRRLCLFALASIAFGLSGCRLELPGASSSVSPFGSSSAPGEATSSRESSQEAFSIEEGDLSRGESISYWCPITEENFFRDKVADFKSIHPEFKGDITLLSTLGEGEVMGKLIMDPERAADLFEIADDNIPRCVDEGVLTPFFSSEVADMRAMYGDIAVTAMTVEGATYAIPYRNEIGYVLAYDKRIVSDEAAKTVEGIIEACKAAGATFNFNLSDAWYSFAPVWAAGGRTYTDDEGVFHADIATQEIAEVVSDFNNILMNAGNTFLNTIDDANMGASGNPVGAVIKWNNEWTQTQKIGEENLGMAPLPSFTSGGKSFAMKSFQGFKAIGIKKADNMTQGKLVTAKAFAEYLTSDETAIERLTTLDQGVPNLGVIAMTDLWTSKFYRALNAQEVAGNTVSQANGSCPLYWDAARGLGTKMSEGSLLTPELALEALEICQEDMGA